MLTVNNKSSSTVKLESRLADSGGKEFKSSSTIQLESRFTDSDTLGRLSVDVNIYVHVTAGVQFHRHRNVILCWFYIYTASCWLTGRRKEIRNLHRWGWFTLTYLLCIAQSTMGHHYYTTSCISHLIVSRFKVQVQHVQMVHSLNSKQNGGYECLVKISPLR